MSEERTDGRTERATYTLSPSKAIFRVISSSSFHHLDMALAVAEALTSNKPQTKPSGCVPSSGNPVMEHGGNSQAQPLVNRRPVSPPSNLIS